MSSNEHLGGLREIEPDQLADTPDIEGWKVITEDGVELGEVHSLIGDVTLKKVRYIDVDLNDAAVETDEHDGHHLLVPVGWARIAADEEAIVVRSLGADDIVRIPTYQAGPITRDYEVSLRRAYDPDYNTDAASDRDFYAGELYETDHLRRR